MVVVVPYVLAVAAVFIVALLFIFIKTEEKGYEKDKFFSAPSLFKCLVTQTKCISRVGLWCERSWSGLLVV